MDLYKICEDLIHDKVEIKDVINKYEISYFKLIDFIKKYCFHYKILIDEDIKKKLDAPLSEMLELRKQGISYGKLSEKYKCGSRVIEKRLVKYCEENDLEIPEKKFQSKIIKLPMEEIYELIKQGMSYNDLALKYHCSSATIRTKLAEYCEENNYEIPETAPCSKSIELPMKEVYELKKKGVSYNDIALKYNCSSFTIRTRLAEYCEENNCKIPETAPWYRSIKLPMKEVYELKKQGVTYNDLASKYNCSSATIRTKLIKYCEENNYSLQGKNIVRFPMKEVYELKKQGITYKDLASKYSCSLSTVKRRLIEYCEENNCKIPETAPWYRSIKLPMKEVYELKKQGVTYNDLASKYNCSSATIRTKLIKYCEENNYSLHGKNIVRLPMKKVYELKKQGITYKDLASKYSCSLSTVKRRLIEYCKENNCKIPKRATCYKSIELPMKEVYELKKQGISYRKIASIYNHSHEVIRTRLVEYCEENNYEIPERAPFSKSIELPMEEIYELKNQGMTYNVLASKYNCSAATIRTRLIEYEEELALKNKYLEILLYDFNKIQEDILNRKIGLFYEERSKGQEESIVLTKK